MDDDLRLLVSNQHHELLTASAAESDLDLAYNLQLQEAIAASLSLPSSSAPQSPPRETDATPPMALQTLELERFLQEHDDHQQWRAEMARVSEDLRIRAHDAKFAHLIDCVPEDEWKRIGDHIQNPIAVGEGSSGGSDNGDPFHLYFKGLPCEEVEDLAAIGVAVCDPKGNNVLKVQKALLGPRPGRKVLDATALMEGLQASLMLGIRRLNVHFDTVPLFNHMTGKWPIKQHNLETIMNQILQLEGKFETFNTSLLPRSQIQSVIKLAKEAIDSHISKGINRNGKQQLKETCSICLEEADLSFMFTIENCKHRFCFSCMKQHVEVKLLHGILPECPHEGCKMKLDVESSKRFLPPKLSEIMAVRVMEASIPDADKVYCPFPKCSALMSRKDVMFPDIGSSSTQSSMARRCIKCGNLFCINCKVPWHAAISCYDFKMLLPVERPDDVKLQALARLRLWRQCIKCNQMIELVEGCYHMTCRCGYEFCYTCGAPWMKKKATCSCPLWDEDFILRNPNNPHQEFDDDSDDDYY